MSPGEGRGFAIRAAAFCVAVFFGLGVYLPFFPLWLADRGLGDAEIGTIIAAPLLVRIVLTPALAQLADRLPSLGAASAFYALLAGLLVAVLALVSGYWPILLLTALALLFWYALLPLTDAVILVGVRDHGIDYARVRLWGSVGFVAASFATAAAIGRFTADGVFILFAASCFVTSIVALALPRVGAPAVPAEPHGFRRAFTDPVLRRAFLAGNLVLAGHGAYYAFGSLYWRSRGFDEGLIAGLWAFSVVAEVVLFWAAKFLPGWDARRFIIAGCVGAVVRWALFPFATLPTAALALQALHAVTFALTHLGVMMAIGAVAMPGHTARLQAVHQTVGGLMLACATAAAGPLFRLSPTGAFWAMAAFALPALYFAYRLRRGLQPQRARFGGATSAPE